MDRSFYRMAKNIRSLNKKIWIEAGFAKAIRQSYMIKYAKIFHKALNKFICKICLMAVDP